MNIEGAIAESPGVLTRPQARGAGRDSSRFRPATMWKFKVKKAVQLSVIASCSFLALCTVLPPLPAAAQTSAYGAGMRKIFTDPAAHCPHPLWDLKRLRLSAERGFTRVVGRSMLPALMPGSLALVMKPGRDIPIRRGMVVMLRDDNGWQWVKRIIAVPGDRLAYREAPGTAPALTLNGKRTLLGPAERRTLSWEVWSHRGYKKGPDGGVAREKGVFEAHRAELPVKGQARAQTYRLLMALTGPRRNHDIALTLAPGRYFVMGDNRRASKDSRDRDFGAIPRGAIFGILLCTASEAEIVRIGRQKS